MLKLFDSIYCVFVRFNSLRKCSNKFSFVPCTSDDCKRGAQQRLAVSSSDIFPHAFHLLIRIRRINM